MVTGVRSSYMTLSRAGDKAIRRKTKTPPNQRRVSPRRASIAKTCRRCSQIIHRSLQRRALFSVGHMTERRLGAPIRRLREGTAATFVQSGLCKKRVGMRCGMRVLLARRVGVSGRRHHSIRDTFLCTIEWTDHAAPIDCYVQTPIKAQDANWFHQLGKNMRSSLCLGCVRRVGGGRSGDLPIARVEGIQNYS